MSSRCRPLSDDEQNEWVAIGRLPESERAAAEIEFARKIMSTADPTFPRELIEGVPNVPPGDISGINPSPSRTATFRPRQIDWADEQAGVDKVIAGNPVIRKALWEPTPLEVNRVAAQIRWDNADEATRQSIVSKANKQKAGLPSTIIVNDWEGLTSAEKRALTIQEIPDHSLEMGHNVIGKVGYEMMDMEYYFQIMQEKTGYPFLDALRRIETSSSTGEINKDVVLRDVSAPKFKKIHLDDTAMKRVAQIINSRNKVPGNPVTMPANATPEEIECADAFEKAYRSYQPKIRYMRVMDGAKSYDAFIKDFPDALAANNEWQLQMAYNLRESGRLDDLYDFLTACDWGVINSGYDPRQITDFSFKPRNKTFSTTRGEGITEAREEVDYPEDQMAHNVFQRLSSYAEQIDIRFQVKPELDNLQSMWNQTKDKFTLKAQGQINGGVQSWIDRIQHMYLNLDAATSLVNKTKVQAMKAIFLNPILSVRNAFQALILHPDRTELIGVVFNKMPADLKATGKLYFDSFVSQMGGIRKDWIYSGEEGWAAFNQVNKLAEALTFYDYSDYIPRLHSFFASLNKANRATVQYLKDGDLTQWMKNSGVAHLRLSEANYVLTHYLGQPAAKFNTGIAGLNDLTGTQMANFYVAQRITDISNFKMKRNTRGIVEMGISGATLWNLIVYPRGYAQRLFFQAEKIKQVFGKDANWEQARVGFSDIVKLVAVAAITGSLYTKITGKKNPWEVISTTFQWQFGGLFVGVGTDLTAMVEDMIAVINPATDPAARNVAFGKLPGEIARNAGTFIPFYNAIVDILDTMSQTNNWDVENIRKLRSLIDKNYTPQQNDAIERNAWEVFQKIFAGSDASVEIDAFTTMAKGVEDAESKLGTIDEETGKFYTLSQFGNEVTSLTKTFPRVLLTKDQGFSDLTLFYLDSVDYWTPYYDLTTDDEKKQYRQDHPEVDAMLIFWGKYSKSVFTKNSAKGKEVRNLLSLWTEQYGITQASEPRADWSDAVPAP